MNGSQITYDIFLNRRKNVYVPFIPTKPNSNIQEVDSVMKKMDKIYGTTFHTWVREGSIDTLATRLRKIINEGYDVNCLVAGFCWLTCTWKINQIGELLIKVFYGQGGLDSPSLAGIVDAIARSRGNESDRLRLILTLMVGETASVNARFIANLTKDWIPSELEPFISFLGTSLSWNSSYYLEFFAEFSSLYFGSDRDMHMNLTSLIQKLYKAFDIISSDEMHVELELLVTVLNILKLEAEDLSLHSFSQAIARLLIAHKSSSGLSKSIEGLEIGGKENFNVF